MDGWIMEGRHNALLIKTNMEDGEYLFWNKIWNNFLKHYRWYRYSQHSANHNRVSLLTVSIMTIPKPCTRQDDHPYTAAEETGGLGKQVSVTVMKWCCCWILMDLLFHSAHRQETTVLPPCVSDLGAIILNSGQTKSNVQPPKLQNYTLGREKN